MSEITLKKDGFYLCDHGKVLDREGLMTGWHKLFSIKEGVTLLDLINCLKEIKAIFTVECLTDCNIESFLSEVFDVWGEIYDAEGNEINNIEKIQISKYFELSEEMCDAVYCSGILKEPIIEEATGIEYNTQGLEFTSWSKLKDLPLEICQEGKFYDGEGSEIKERTFLVSIKLGEFLCGLFDELSFFGSPHGRDEQHDSLKKTIDDIKSGRCEFISWEDVDEDLKEIKDSIRRK